jgi:hypothetical protein
MRSLRIAEEASSFKRHRYLIEATKRPELARISAYDVNFELKIGSA